MSFGASVAVGDDEVVVGEPQNEIEPGTVYVYQSDSAAPGSTQPEFQQRHRLRLRRGQQLRRRDLRGCFGSNETALSIADVTDKTDPVAVAMATYPDVAYTHQGWFDEEHRYFYMKEGVFIVRPR